jgi:hypothetical protein
VQAYHKWRLREFDKAYEQLRSALSGVTFYASDREFTATLPAVERKVLARLLPIQKMIVADRAAKTKQHEKEERAAWKKDHPGRTLRDLDASLHANDQDAWMEWDMWRLRHDDPEYYAKLDAEKAETAA